jgi:hypothetical protein
MKRHGARFPVESVHELLWIHRWNSFLTFSDFPGARACTVVTAGYEEAPAEWAGASMCA